MLSTRTPLCILQAVILANTNANNQLGTFIRQAVGIL